MHTQHRSDAHFGREFQRSHLFADEHGEIQFGLVQHGTGDNPVSPSAGQAQGERHRRRISHKPISQSCYLSRRRRNRLPGQWRARKCIQHPWGLSAPGYPREAESLASLVLCMLTAEPLAPADHVAESLCRRELNASRPPTRRSHVRCRVDWCACVCDPADWGPQW